MGFVFQFKPLVATTCLLLAGPVGAAKVPATSASSKDSESLAKRLTTIKVKTQQVEEQLIRNLKDQQNARAKINSIRRLLKLYEEQQVVARARLTRLRSFLGELEKRRDQLQERSEIKQAAIKQWLIRIVHLGDLSPKEIDFPSQQPLIVPREFVLKKLVSGGIADLESMKNDMLDVEHLEGRITQERSQLEFVLHDLKEQRQLLEFHRQIQSEKLATRLQARAAQLQHYRDLKDSESRVEALMNLLTARVDFENDKQKRVEALQSTQQNRFIKMKGKLDMPLTGKILTKFGRTFDQKSQLYIFKKGIEIAAEKNAEVRAIYPGKVVYSGRLPRFGKVAILDHGGKYYSLVGRLGKLRTQVGQILIQDEVIGMTDPKGGPVYFEIRSGNVALNPLQWVSNSNKVNI